MKANVRSNWSLERFPDSFITDRQVCLMRSHPRNYPVLHNCHYQELPFPWISRDALTQSSLSLFRVNAYSINLVTHIWGLHDFAGMRVKTKYSWAVTFSGNGYLCIKNFNICVCLCGSFDQHNEYHIFFPPTYTYKQAVVYNTVPKVDTRRMSVIYNSTHNEHSQIQAYDTTVIHPYLLKNAIWTQP